jgi:hypothetical protein
MDDFDYSDLTLNIAMDFASLSSLPPLDMMHIDDAPYLLNVPDHVTFVIDVTNIL